MESGTPFHEGERQVQTQLGVRQDIEPWARRVIRPYLPQEHRRFHTQLPFLVAAARDRQGQPWATLLTGPDDFVRSPDPEHLWIDTRPVPGDALENALVAGTEIGLLGIDLATRRRNRVNGRIAAAGKNGLEFRVGQSFGNCPQYIHVRDWQRVQAPQTPIPARHSVHLSARQQRWIQSADTFFIASGYTGEGESGSYGMDASHRGGEPGFVEVESRDRLLIPDYAGNNHYNTVGNLLMDPRAGLLFVDFERGGLLQLTGRIRIDWDSPAVARRPGARRLLIFDLETVIELESALPLRWSGANGSVRSLRLVEKIPESEGIASFVFTARDDGALPDFEAGQHLPIEVKLPGYDQPQRRTYSLSSAPGQDRYRITVKRESQGLVSKHLHDAVEVGTIIDSLSPAGEFVLAAGSRPVVLLSAGVGLTPMVSMLHALSGADDGRSVWFIHGARDGGQHALSEEVGALAGSNDRIEVRVAYSRPRRQDRPGIDFHSKGRIDTELVDELLPNLDAEFYLCGPTGFLAGLSTGLEARGVLPERIHAETFGPIG